MRVTVLLADLAQADSVGKVHMIGLGWTRTGVPAGPMAIVALLRLDDVEETSQPHEVGFDLVDASGKQVSMTPGGKSLKLTAKVEPSSEAPIELPAVAPVVWQLGGGLLLDVGQTYTWRITVDGKQHEDWTASFATHEQ